MGTYFFVVATFMAFMIGIGLYFSRRQTSTEAYFVASRSIPGWAMGLSLFATLISSVSFIAYPGAGYEGKWWASLVPVLAAPLHMLVALYVLIPVYRHFVSISVYEYIERRFDRVTRIYSTMTFFLLNFAKMAFVFYLVALTVNAIAGWDVYWVIVVVGLITVFYTFIGGLEAVIWTDVIQGIILWVGGIVALAYTLLLPPGGPVEVLRLAWQNNRFDFGSVDFTLAQPTLLMMLAVGFLEGLQKSAADQAVVQRYMVAKSGREAAKGTIFSTVMTVASSALFTLIGVCLWSFYRITGDTLPVEVAEKSEKVFPHFLQTQVPTIFGAIVLAALMSAAMSTVSSALNGFGAVVVEDYYRWIRPASTDRERLAVGKLFVVICGVLCIGLALLLVLSKGTAIELWYVVASIVSAGIVGMFFLALASTRANRQGIYAGIVVAVGFTAWATLTIDMKASSETYKTFDLGMLDTPIHSYMIGIISSILFVVVGYMTSFLFPENSPEKQALTFWGWLEIRKREKKRSQ